jgi:N-acetylglutamate synthase-like GNAT family acetyltransferase
MRVRRATATDLDQVSSLLAAAELPDIPSALPLANVLVASEGSAVLGAMALEVRGLRGVLRSAVVAPDHRRQGVGTSLLHSLLSRAHELSLRQLYLIPGDASEFFSRFGFEPLDPAALPSEIRSLLNLKEEGADKAAVLCADLASICV